MRTNLFMYIKNNINTSLILFILIVGAVLRCYHFFNIPMTHDELSAIYRLDHPTFYELIENGVKQDGHPAGIQVFLYYWTNVFGFKDWVIKLPFILMGLGSIFVAYAIAKKWFNSTSALIIAAFISSLQFPIMYSQIARPYISGMFFCLLMVYFWTNYLFHGKNSSKTSLIGFILSASVCSYNHHFSLLFAFIIYTTGLFFLKRKTVIPYIISGFAILVLYIPHLEIFFYQLNVQGLDWLGTPRNSFILDHIKYIFHFSNLVYACVGILFIGGIVNQFQTKTPLRALQIISICWFFCSLLIGFFYSIYIKPVLQHSVLIFSFPFLLFFLFSFIQTDNKWFKTISVVVVLAVNIFSLIYSRKHYEIFYQQPFNVFSEKTKDFLKTHRPEDVSVFLSENPKYIDHYFKKDNPGILYVSTPNVSLDSLRTVASAANTNYLICGNLPAEYVLALKENYPYVISKTFGFTHEYYILSKKTTKEETTINEILFDQSLTFEQANTSWNYVGKTDLLANKVSVYKMDSTMEWGPYFQIPLMQISKSRHHFIDVSIEYLSEEIGDGLIAFELKKNDSMLVWQGTKVKHFYTALKKDSWQKAYFSFRLTNQFKHIEEMENCTLTVFYWNIDKRNLLLDNFSVRVREGNPKVYSLVEDFQE